MSVALGTCRRLDFAQMYNRCKLLFRTGCKIFFECKITFAGGWEGSGHTLSSFEKCIFFYKSTKIFLSIKRKKSSFFIFVVLIKFLLYTFILRILSSHFFFDEGMEHYVML